MALDPDAGPNSHWPKICWIRIRTENNTDPKHCNSVMTLKCFGNGYFVFEVAVTCRQTIRQSVALSKLYLRLTSPKDRSTPTPISPPPSWFCQLIWYGHSIRYNIMRVLFSTKYPHQGREVAGFFFDEKTLVCGIVLVSPGTAWTSPPQHGILTWATWTGSMSCPSSPPGIQCWGSVTFCCGSGSVDPYLWLTDPDPTPDPTPFFSNFQDAKKKKNYFIFVVKFYFASIISVRATSSWEKGKIQRSGSGANRKKVSIQAVFRRMRSGLGAFLYWAAKDFDLLLKSQDQNQKKIWNIWRLIHKTRPLPWYHSQADLTWPDRTFQGLDSYK
jgi:hypothetical protein